MYTYIYTYEFMSIALLSRGINSDIFRFSHTECMDKVVTCNTNAYPGRD